MMSVLFRLIVMLILISHLLKVEGSSTSTSTAVNNCYTFHDVASTWQEADKECKEMGAHLVTMETTEEWNNVRTLIKEKVKKSGSYTHWYIGLRHKSGTWKWTKPGSPDVDVALNDNRWLPYQPSSGDSANPSEPCGEINALIGKVRGHFNDVKCNVKYSTHPRGYICANF